MKNTRNCPNCSLEFNIQGDWIGTCPVCNKTIAVKNNTVEVPEFKILYDPEKGPTKEFQFGTPLYYDPNTAGNTDFSFKRVLCGVALFIVACAVGSIILVMIAIIVENSSDMILNFIGE